MKNLGGEIACNLKMFFQLTRPAQQIKQFFVVAPVFYSFGALNIETLIQLVLAVLLFILVTTIVYCQNDLYDWSKGVSIPEVQHRPIVQGKVSRYGIRQVQTACLFTSVALIPLFANWKEITYLISIYLVINYLYTQLELKKNFALSLVCVTHGYPLRFQIGTLALNQPTSSWGLLLVALIAISLYFGKRVRRSMNARMEEDLQSNQLGLYVSISTTTAAYITFAQSSYAIDQWDFDYLILSSLPLFISLLIYARVSQRKSVHDRKNEDVNDSLYREWALLLLVSIWSALVILARLNA